MAGGDGRGEGSQGERRRGAGGKTAGGEYEGERRGRAAFEGHLAHALQLPPHVLEIQHAPVALREPAVLLLVPPSFLLLLLVTARECECVCGGMGRRGEKTWQTAS